MWLALRSVKSNNVDFLNQIRYFSCLKKLKKWVYKKSVSLQFCHNTHVPCKNKKSISYHGNIFYLWTRLCYLPSATSGNPNNRNNTNTTRNKCFMMTANEISALPTNFVYKEVYLISWFWLHWCQGVRRLERSNALRF